MNSSTQARPVLATLETVLRQTAQKTRADQMHWLDQVLSADLGRLDVDLGRCKHSQTTLAEQAAAHLLSHPGKRLRPLCLFIAARIGQPDKPEHIHDLAMAAELTHAATLLHDDVIDRADLRRGAPTARLLFGNAASILGGDHLLVEALRRVHRCHIDGLVLALLKVIDTMVEAEAIQLEQQLTATPDRTLCERIIVGKTASLFRWALVAGGRAGGLSTPALDRLDQAGYALGFGFQLTDDALDLSGDPALTGKTLAGDLLEGKLTWPVVVACERDASLKDRLLNIRLHHENPQGAIEAITATGAIADAQAEALARLNTAHSHFESLPPGEAQRALCAISTLLISRVS